MANEESRVSWLAQAHEAVALARNAEEAERQVEVLEDARADFDRLLAEFQLLVGGIAVVRSFGWEGKTPPPDLKRDLAEASETLDSRPLNRVSKSLERYMSDVRAAVVQEWSEHAASRLGDVGDLISLSETLSEVDGIAKTSHELQTALGELWRVQNSIPTAESADLLKRTEALLLRLEESLKPDSVRRFLSAVARGGAAVEAMTDDVVDWLTKHHALNRFRITAGTPVDDADV